MYRLVVTLFCLGRRKMCRWLFGKMFKNKNKKNWNTTCLVCEQTLAFMSVQYNVIKYQQTWNIFSHGVTYLEIFTTFPSNMAPLLIMAPRPANMDYFQPQRNLLWANNTLNVGQHDRNYNFVIFMPLSHVYIELEMGIKFQFQ